MDTNFVSGSARRALVWLYCRTGGKSNDVVHRIVSRRAPPVHTWPTSALGSPPTGTIDGAVRQLREDGVAVFPELLDQSDLEHLRGFAAEQLASPRTPVDPDLSVVWFDERRIIGDQVVQKLASDPGLLAIAESYLGSEPRLSIATMWWSRPVAATDESLEKDAQKYHFDLDTPKWVKFFVYINEVTPATGPHVFVRGTHRPGVKPKELLDRGYVRFDDPEVERFFGDRVVELTGPAGTMFMADTLAFHKGKLPETGHRIVLQLEFCDTWLFHSRYPGLSVPVVDEQLRTVLHRRPRVYSHWGFVEVPDTT